MVNIYSAVILLPANFDLMSGNKIKEYETTHTFSFLPFHATTNKADRKVIACINRSRKVTKTQKILSNTPMYREKHLTSK